MKRKIPVKDASLLNRIAQSIYDRKGMNILALDVRGTSSFLTDYFIIAEGNVERHVASLARGVVDEMHDLKCYHVEGLQAGDWVVIDFGHIVVHLFHPDLREHYNLEQIWTESEIVNLNICVD